MCDSDDQACRNEPGSYSCVNPDGSLAKPFLSRRDEGSHVNFLINFSLYIAVSVVVLYLSLCLFIQISSRY